MKVKDLLAEIEKCRKKYGGSFLNWDVYSEQLTEEDKAHKRVVRNGGIVRDTDFCANIGNCDTCCHKYHCDDWEYFACTGFWTKFEKDKIFTINVNY